MFRVLKTLHYSNISNTRFVLSTHISRSTLTIPSKFQSFGLRAISTNNKLQDIENKLDIERKHLAKWSKIENRIQAMTITSALITGVSFTTLIYINNFVLDPYSNSTIDLIETISTLTTMISFPLTLLLTASKTLLEDTRLESESQVSKFVSELNKLKRHENFENRTTDML